LKGRVLIIAGSDSGGGAGIQADIKTVTLLGGYAATAITALTAQNTLGVRGIMGVDPAFVKRQMEAVLDDIGADCIKTGMLYSGEIIQAVREVIETKAADTPLVVDPVMLAKDGTPLLDPGAVALLKERLIPKVTLLTPNVPEAEALTGMTIHDIEQMAEAGARLMALGANAVLVKGGHLPAGERVCDVLVCNEGQEVFDSPRISTPHTHGTGCTLASAIATGLAQGLRLRDAVVRAQSYLLEAIRHAPRFGQGQGPIGHGSRLPFSS
jgi:hydroxymethylpyrimidine/phosphomethylpyrimidine kinase